LPRSAWNPRVVDFAARDILIEDKKIAADRRLAVCVHFGLFS
jgi:hypothetical protein